MSKKYQPCKECPFLKDSMPGWLGPGTGFPDLFIASTEHTILHCHTVPSNYGRSGLAKKKVEHPCIGAMQFMANSCKHPRGAREPGQYQVLFDKYSHPNVRVFKWPGEFIKHHTLNDEQRKAAEQILKTT